MLADLKTVHRVRVPLFVHAKAMLRLLLRPQPKASLLFNLQFQHHYNNYHPSIPFLKFFSTSTSSHSFTVSYLINNCDFSPQTALKASHKLTLSDSQKPDSILAFFTTHGFSNSQIRDIIRKELWLLSCSDPNKLLLPKFQFLLSKGASSSDIVRIVNANPKYLKRSLQNHIIPTYDFVRGFLQSDKQTIACVNRYCFLSSDDCVTNVKLLLDQGMNNSKIAMLFRIWPRLFCSFKLLSTVEELKQLGFNSSTLTFGVALLAKTSVNKTRWDQKVETFKKWGWSDEQVIHAFKKQPYCMLSSTHKIDAVMSFWVHHLGLDSLDLLSAPMIFQLSLDKRIIPRASVLQFLTSKGLRKKDAAIGTPFALSEELFLNRFVKCFKEDSFHLLKLYEEKMNLANSREKKSLPGKDGKIISK